MGLAEERHLVVGEALMALAGSIDRRHGERMDLRDHRPLEPPDELAFAELVHQEADRAAVHAVNRDAIAHEAVQRLQHEAVAAERNDCIGFLRRGVAIEVHKPLERGAGLGHVTRHERDPLELPGALGHRLPSTR